METPASIPLRPATSADLRALHALDQVCYPPGIAYSLREMRYFLSRPGAISLLAESAEGELAGFAIAEPTGDSAHLITIDVAPEARRKGIGTLLMDAIEQALAAKGATLLRLEVAVDNPAAQNFYLRRGFTPRGIIRGYYLGTLDALTMKKSLPPP